MTPGTPTRTSVVDGRLPPAGWELLWLPRSRVSHGDAMPDRAALIEVQIPGLRHFACALLRGDRERADDPVQDTLERALSRWHLRRVPGDLALGAVPSHEFAALADHGKEGGSGTTS